MTDHRTPDGLPNALRGVDRHLVGPADPSGSRWWARADDGTRNLVTIVPGDAPGGTDEVRRRVATVQRVQQEHIVTLGPLLRLPDDGLAVLEQHVQGHDLDTVRAARGPWSPGEVVAVLGPLAGAVAALHDAGLRYRVSSRNVVLTTDGRPVLVGILGDGGVLGAGGLLGPDGGGDLRVGEDVAALGRLGLELLQPADPGPDGVARRRPAGAEPSDRLQRLDRSDPQHPSQEGPELAWSDRVRQVLTAAVDPSAQERPSASRLASELSRACPPARVEQPDPAVLAGLAVRRQPDPAGDRGRHRRPSHPARRWLQAGAVVIALVLCGVTVAATVTGSAHENATVVAHESVQQHGADRSPDGEGAVPGAPDAPVAGTEAAAATAEGATEAADTIKTLVVPADPVDAAVLLTQARAQALAHGDLVALRLVTVPGSPAARGDEAAADQVAAAGLSGGTLSTRIELAERVPIESASGGECPGCAAVRLRSAVTVTPAGDPDGGVVPVEASQTRDGAPASAPRARDVVLVLAPTGDGWRVSEVRPYVP